MRAQSSLPALGVALLLLTAATLLGVTAANGALAAADRDALDRQAAVALSDRLTADRAPVTTRPNVVNDTRLDTLNASTLRATYGLDEDAAVRVRLGNRTLAAAGDPTDGVTVRRLVLREATRQRTLTPAFTGTRTVTLPRRTDALELTLAPPDGTTLRQVEANGRVVLRNTSGLSGTYEVPVSPLETTRLRFDADGPLGTGSVRIGYAPERTRKAELAVTVDG